MLGMENNVGGETFCNVTRFVVHFESIRYGTMQIMPHHVSQPSPRPEAIDMESLEASFGDASLNEEAAPPCPFRSCKVAYCFYCR